MADPVALTTGQGVTAAMWNDIVDFILGLRSGAVTVTLYNVKIKTGAYSAIAADLVLCSGTFTVTLPAASANSKLPIWVVNNGSGTITVGHTGSDTVGLVATQTLNPGTGGAQGDSMCFMSDGISNYNIV